MTDRHVTRMTLDDAEHYTPAQKAAIIASYPEHEDARTKGHPDHGFWAHLPICGRDDFVPADPDTGHWVQLAPWISAGIIPSPG